MNMLECIHWVRLYYQFLREFYCYILNCIIVEERLKKVDPESFNKLTMQGTLLDKLTFLLNGTNAGQTVLFSITVPPGKSPQTSTVAHVRYVVFNYDTLLFKQTVTRFICFP